MKRVTGIGGIFFKSKDPDSMRTWYQTHLGFNAEPYGTMFHWREADDPEKKAYTLWNPFKDSTKYFEPSEKEFMLNFRVENLEALLPLLKEEGVQIVGELQVHEYGKFAHIMDPEGNKIELWEDTPQDAEKTES